MNAAQQILTTTTSGGVSPATIVPSCSWGVFIDVQGGNAIGVTIEGGPTINGPWAAVTTTATVSANNLQWKSESPLPWMRMVVSSASVGVKGYLLYEIC